MTELEEEETETAEPDVAEIELEDEMENVEEPTQDTKEE